MKEEIRKKLITLGMSPDADDAAAKRFAEENGIEIIETNETDAGRAADLLALASRAGLFEEVRQMLKNGKSQEDVLGKIILAQENSSRAGNASIGMNEKEVKEYSLFRAVNAVISGDWSKAGLEREVNEAAARAYGKNSDGMSVHVPHDVVVGKRVITTGTTSGATGGNLVPTDYLAGSFIELLRNRLVLTRMGAKFLPGLRGNVAIPKQTGGATAYWVAENGAVTASDPTFSQLVMTPKTVGALTQVSRNMIIQSSPAIESLVWDDLSLCLAGAIENAAINGTGTNNQPTGVLKSSGIGTVAIGTNGGAPTWAKIVEMETLVAAGNVYNNGTMGYLLNAKTRGVFKTIPKFTNTGLPIFENYGNDEFGSVNGYRAAVTNYLSSTGTKGNGTNLSTALFGRFSDLIIAMWSGLDILIDPYSASAQGQVQLRAMQSVDTNIRYAESFCACTDIVA